jgi:gliding motility-associated-like protein
MIMKKIILLFLLFTSFFGFCQLNLEGFEASSTALPLGWNKYHVGSGTNVWNITGVAGISCGGNNAAVINRPGIGIGNTSIDYLVTAQFTVPVNPQLQFTSRQSYPGDNGSSYKVYISTNADPSVLTSYTLLKTYTELEMNPEPASTCNNLKLDILASYTGQQVYIALVREFTRTDVLFLGERWILDDISVVSKCPPVTNLTSVNPSSEFANIGWTAPAGSTTWIVNYSTVGGAMQTTGPLTIASPGLTKVGNVVTYKLTGDPIGNPNGLSPGTQYLFCVINVCSPTNQSDCTDPLLISTIQSGADCYGALPIGGLPYQTTSNTGLFLDNTDIIQGANCGALPPATNYSTGNEVYYRYTAAETGLISIKLTPTGPNSSIFVYSDNCPIAGPCLAGVANNNGTVRFINNFAVTAGQKYIIVISSGGTTQTVGYTLLIQKENCTPPVGTFPVPVGGITQTSAYLDWINPTGASSWQVAVQLLDAGVPLIAGTTVASQNFTATQTLSGDLLTEGKRYEYYVRSECAPGVFSSWAGPYPFNTVICLPADKCNHTFRMTDSGNNGWQGAIMQVRQGGIVVGEIGPTYTTAGGAGPVDVIIPLCKNKPFDLYWSVAGTAPAQCKVAIINKFGQTLFTKAAGSSGVGQVVYNNTVNCDVPVCTIPPINVAVVTGTITTNGATIQWDAPATTAWDIYYVPAGGLAPNALTAGATVTTNPFAISGLDPDTAYDVYVRVQCSPAPSLWSAPVTFTTLPTCFKPTNPIAATAITTTGATFSWTSAGTQFEMLFIASPTPPATLPSLSTPATHIGITALNFSPTNLQPATIYYAYVRNVCSSTNISSWTPFAVFNTLTCDPLAKCNYKFVLTNTAGNSWNGGRMLVRQNGIVVATLGAASINNAAGVSVGICPGVPFDLYWSVPGTLAENIGVSIQNPFLDVLYTKAPGAGTAPSILYSSVGNCTPAPCSKPTLMAAIPSATSAQLSWTDNSTPVASVYDLYVVPTGQPAPSNDPVTTPTISGVTLSGGFYNLTTLDGTTLLAPSTSYTYYVRTSCGAGVYSTWTILTPTTFITTPVNDECVNATAVTINTNQTCLPANNATGNTYGAVSSLPASLPTLTGAGCGATNKDVWYKFVALNTAQTINISNIVPTPSTTTVALNFSVFSGACNNLTKLFCNTTSSLDATGLTPGDTYYIRVYNASATPTTFATFDLCITSPPVNDECVNAAPITINTGQTCLPANNATGNTYGATASLPILTVPLTGAGCGATNKDIWYKFVALNAAQTINISNIVPTPSTASVTLNFSVFSGNCTSLTKLFCNTSNTLDATGLTIGDTYYIRVYNSSATPTSFATFDICITSPPANDECVNSTPVTVNTGQTCLPVNNVAGNTFGATTSLPILTVPLTGTGCGQTNKDVWYKFVASYVSQTISINNVVSSPVTPAVVMNFSLFSGTCSNLTKLYCSTASTLDATGLTVGDTYYIRVYTATNVVNQSATFDLCITSPPVNDECAFALPVTVNTGQECVPTNNVAGNTYGALPSLPILAVPLTGTGCGQTNKDVWFKFVATNTSQTVSVNDVVFSPSSATAVLNFSVFSGTCTNLTKIICSTTSNVNVLGLTPGETYYVRVYPSTNVVGQSATFNICVTSPPVNNNCDMATEVAVNLDQNCFAPNNALGNTYGATPSLPILTVPLTGTGCGQANEDVWFKFVAANTSQTISINDIVFTPATAAAELNFSVFSGPCTDLTKILCSTLNVANATGLIPTQTYYIRVYAKTAVVGQSAKFKVCITSPPINDLCVNATNVPVNTNYNCIQNTYGNTLGATSSTPTLTGAGCGVTDDDVWYKFVATNAVQFINLDVVTSIPFDVTLNHTVFSGDCNSLVKLYCSTNGNSVATGLTVGNTYYIRVYTSASTPDKRAVFKLCIKSPPPPATNDECITAIAAPVNLGGVCTLLTQGNIIGATQSNVPNTAPTCVGISNDDVWFSFVATADTHFVSLLNVEGTSLDLNYAVYSGACGALVKEYCSAAGVLSSTYTSYVIGQTYYVRVWSNLATSQTTVFDLCIRSISTCETAEPFCGGGPTNSLVFENTTGIPSTGQIACLFTTPNPTYFFLQVNETGALAYDIRQSTDINNFPTTVGPPALDVDYVCWGPFNSAQACSQIEFGPCSPVPCPNNTTNPNFYPLGNVVDCSYSGNGFESLSIPNAQAGEYYLLLITNFIGQPGYIKLFQTNYGVPGTGNNANLCCAVDLGATKNICAQSLLLNALELLQNPSSYPGSFVWYKDDVVIPNETGPTITVTESGTYKVVGTCGLNTISDDVIVNLTRPAIPETLADYGVCDDATNDGFAAFDLTTINAQALGTLDPLLYNVTYHLTQIEANLGTGSMATTSPYTNTTVNQQTIYVRVEEKTVATCYSTVAVTLRVNPLPAKPIIADIKECLLNPIQTLTPIVPTGVDVQWFDAAVAGAVVTNPTWNQEGQITYYAETIAPNLDYTLTSGSVTIPAGQTSATFEVPTLTDTSTESPETFNLIGTITSGNTLNTGATAIGVMSDAMANRVISISEPKVLEGTSAIFNISISSPSTTATVMNIVTTIGTADLTDFTPPIVTTATIPAGQTVVSVSIPTLVDAVAEVDEQFQLKATVTSANTTNTIATANATITETATLPSLVVSGANTVEGTNAMFTISLSAPSTVDTVINFNTTSGTAGSSGCRSADRTPVVLEIYPLPLAPTNTNNDISECALSPLQTLTAAITPVTGTTVLWYTTEVGGTPLTTPPILNSITTVEYYAESVADITLCKSATRTKVTLTIKPIPAAPTTLKPVDRQCQLVPIQTIVPTAEVLSGETFHWYGAAIGGAVVPNPSLNTVSSVDYYAETIKDGCPSTTRTKVTLEIYPLVSKPTVDTAGIFTSCAVSPIQTLTASAIPSTGASIVWYSVLTGGTPLTTAPILSTVGTVTYYAESLDTTTNCRSLERLPVVLTIKIVPDFVLQGGCKGGKYLIEATPSSTATFDPTTATYKWTNAAGTTIGTNSSTLVVTQSGIYNCEITNAEGCSFDEDFNANSISCTIQKGISPKGVNGGDGDNDYFDLTALNVTSLEIFNRYGLKVYSKDDYKKEWFGQSDNGNELPDGTYYYVIKLTDGDPKTGWVYINREQ